MIKQGLDYDGNPSLVWLSYNEECSKAYAVVSGNRGDQSALWTLLQKQFCDLANSQAGSLLYRKI